MPIWTKSKIAVSGVVPQHVAIIMDGNGRWAKAKGMPRSAGHKKGAGAIQEALKGCQELGINYLTLYAFSSENWKRSPDEVDQLMELLRYYLDHELQNFHQQGVCLKVVGDSRKLADDIVDKIRHAEHLTAQNTSIQLNIALSYGSRQEITHAVQMLVKEVISGQLHLDQIDEQQIEKNLYMHHSPDPDLLIRTGGDQRLSNFLLWQLAYTELLFLDILWPDFKKHHFLSAVDEYQKRERRYGT